MLLLRILCALCALISRLLVNLLRLLRGLLRSHILRLLRSLGLQCHVVRLIVELCL